jgi:seryl-tRNA synthetase
LQRALIQFFLDEATKAGYEEIIPPLLVNADTATATGQLPDKDGQMYYCDKDQLYLIPTAEVPVTNILRDEILEEKQLPVRFCGYTPCFRREAGAHSKDVKGLIRVHEFYKFEQVVLCEATHEESVKYHEEVNRNTEEFIESLGIPYHTVVNCGGDLGLGQVKKYDVELWVPRENTYREISSASYFHDFQTRRLGIRYRDTDGKLKYAHSLNSTAIPTPRILVSLVENYQQADGSIIIPEVLRPYMGGREKISKK